MQRKDDTEPDHALDPDLQAYVDGKLSPDAAAEVEARLACDDTARTSTASWRHHRNLIRAAAEAMDTGPTDIRTAALERELARRLTARKRQALIFSPRLRQLAASVAIFSFGWLAHDGYGRLTQPEHPGYINEALAAHQVFAYDSLHPVEFRPGEMELALDWLSDKMGHKLDSPKLDALGLEVVGARLVGTQDGPAGLFIYEDATGERLSVIMTAHAPEAPLIPLRVTRQGEQSVAYWSDEALDYVVLGRHDQALLTRIAAAVSIRD